jgi:hypothetical protein
MRGSDTTDWTRPCFSKEALSNLREIADDLL